MGKRILSLALMAVLALGLAACQTVSPERLAYEKSRLPAGWQQVGVRSDAVLYSCVGKPQCGAEWVTMLTGHTTLRSSGPQGIENAMRSQRFANFVANPRDSREKVTVQQRLTGAYPGYHVESRIEGRNGTTAYRVKKMRAHGNRLAVVFTRSDSLAAARRSSNLVDPLTLLRREQF